MIKTNLKGINSKTMIIYGENNTGKTTFLRENSHNFYVYNLKKLYEGSEKFIPFFYIPSNRLPEFENKIKINSDSVDEDSLKMLNGAFKGSYKDSILNRLLSNENQIELLKFNIKKIFNIDFDVCNIEQYSEGVHDVLILFACISYCNDIFKMNDLDNTDLKAIIFIDEFELYLHVKTQEKTLNSLTKTFPRMKFVLTTHSPLLIQRTNKCELFEMDSNHNINSIEENYYFRDLDFICNELFDLELYPSEYVKLLNYTKSVLTSKKIFNLTKFQTLLTNVRKKYVHFESELIFIENDMIERFSDDSSK